MEWSELHTLAVKEGVLKKFLNSLFKDCLARSGPAEFLNYLLVICAKKRQPILFVPRGGQSWACSQQGPLASFTVCLGGSEAGHRSLWEGEEDWEQPQEGREAGAYSSPPTSRRMAQSVSVSRCSGCRVGVGREEHGRMCSQEAQARRVPLDHPTRHSGSQHLHRSLLFYIQCVVVEHLAVPGTMPGAVRTLVNLTYALEESTLRYKGLHRCTCTAPAPYCIHYRHH